MIVNLNYKIYCYLKVNWVFDNCLNGDLGGFLSLI